MSNLSKHQAIESSINHLSVNQYGYFITLNSLTPSKIKFNQNLDLITDWLNDYCYGRKFKRGENRLKIIGGIETGICNEGLHAHLVLTYDLQMKRSIQEIDSFIRKKWYALNQANGSIYGTLVRVEKIKDLKAAVIYSLKDSNKKMNSDAVVTFLS